jgi:hypothetical protein
MEGPRRKLSCPRARRVFRRNSRSRFIERSITRRITRARQQDGRRRVVDGSAFHRPVTNNAMRLQRPDVRVLWRRPIRSKRSPPVVCLFLLTTTHRIGSTALVSPCIALLLPATRKHIYTAAPWSDFPHFISSSLPLLHPKSLSTLSD